MAIENPNQHAKHGHTVFVTRFRLAAVDQQLTGDMKTPGKQVAQNDRCGRLKVGIQPHLLYLF